MTPANLALMLEWLDTHRRAVGLATRWPQSSVLRDCATWDEAWRRVRLEPGDLAVAVRSWRLWAPHYGWRGD